LTALAAITVGSEMPSTDFDALVTGVFDRACNIRLANGRLATCTTANYFDMPRGIRVDNAEGFRFATVLRCGASAHCRGGIVRFAASGLKIDCRAAAVWRGEFLPRARPPVRLLRRLWRMARSGAVEFPPGSCPQSLIGRGAGLTPAGDDVLAGLLAAPMLVAPTRRSSRTLAVQTRLHLCATNEVGAEMLFDATQGLFIEPVVSLLSAIYGNGGIENAIRNLRAVGATSGAAMLLGVLAGVADVENIKLSQVPDSAERMRVA
jgi:hypothetical protein